MMDDHAILCRARNGLADALKVLLNPEIMDASDFENARAHAVNAIKALDGLLNPSSDGQQIDPLKGSGWLSPLLRLHCWMVRP